MASVELDSLVKRFGGPEGTIVANDNIDLTIEDGEFIVIVGPSGSGKSTALRTIAGLEEPTEGRVLIGGEDVTDLPPRDRDVAMVFQNYALYPHLDARANMSFGLKMQGELSSEEIEQRVDEASKMMGIHELLDKMPSELSGGQQQRIALGRAIVRDPAVFLMDEPLSNLDAKLRTKMRTEIQELQADLGTTTIYVTHNQTEAMTMADRIAVMDGGEIQQISTPLEAYYEPTNEFVAGFIGSPSMNFLEMDLEWTDEELAFSHPAFSYQPSIEMRQAIDRSASAISLGIRPEDIELGERDGENVTDVEVVVVEPLGKEQLVYFELGGEKHKASLSGEYDIRTGETLPLRFPTRKVHLFDAESGETIKNRDRQSSGESIDAALSAEGE
ncbi:MAG: sugar ABC transporter ATP-binding protein [Halobacteriales archaeon SW_8_66_22]|nr:MAG: sugar ABC transporter ATP-binding protein [Halobacteriales archaeon SW_8_66_22]